MIELLAKRVSARLSGERAAQVPWELIIELVLVLIEQCLQNRRVFLAASRNPTFLQRAAVNVAARRVIGIGRRDTLLALQNAVLTVAVEATDEELVQCHQEAAMVLGLDYDMSPVRPEPEPA